MSFIIKCIFLIAGVELVIKTIHNPGPDTLEMMCGVFTIVYSAVPIIIALKEEAQENG